MKPFLKKLRTHFCTTPVIAVLVAAVFVGGLFAIDRWNMLPMEGQATPMYGEMHNAATSRSKPKTTLKRAAKGSGSSTPSLKAVRAAKRAARSAASASAASK